MSTLKDSYYVGLIAGLVSIYLGIPVTLATLGAASSDLDFSESFGSSLLGAGLLAGVESLGFTSAPTESSSEPAEEFGPFWKDSSGDWHLGDEMPYSVVEQKAAQVYDCLNGKKHSSPKFPAIIADSASAYEALRKFIGEESIDSITKTIEILEIALENGQK